MSILRVRQADGSWAEILAITGKDAYDGAVDAGYTGSENDFYAALALVDDSAAITAENAQISSAAADAAALAKLAAESAASNASASAIEAGVSASNALASENAAKTAQSAAEEASGTAASVVSSHNTASNAHSDIRTAVSDAVSAASAVQGNLNAHDGNTTKHITEAERTAWNAKSNFSGNYNDLSNKPTIPTVPTNVSAFTNDAGYITSAPVLSVNSKTGAVQLSASDVGALPLSGGTMTGALVPAAGISFVVKDGYIAYPDGGQFSLTNSAAYGYLKIKLPIFYTTSTMLAFRIGIYNSVENPYVEYLVSGYTAATWSALQATCLTPNNNDYANLPVHFGKENSVYTVAIGNSNTVWRYPKVFIKEIFMGHGKSTLDMWCSGWSMEVSPTAMTETHATIENTSAFYGKASMAEVNSAISAAIEQMKTETWTFTLEDGSIVTKAVYIG